MTFDIGKGYRDAQGRMWHVLFKTPLLGGMVLSLVRREPPGKETYALAVVEKWPGKRAYGVHAEGYITIYDYEE